MNEPVSALSGIRCSNCGATYAADQLLTVCATCGKVLLAEYDLEAAARTLTKEAVRERIWNLWRYAEIMPVRDPQHRLTLGEGGTPLLPLPRARRGHRAAQAADQGRGPQPDRHVQGARAGGGRLAGAGAGRADDRAALGRATPAARGRAYAARGGLRRGRLHAGRRAAGHQGRVPRATARASILVDGLINDAGKIVASTAPSAAGSTSRR